MAHFEVEKIIDKHWENDQVITNKIILTFIHIFSKKYQNFYIYFLGKISSKMERFRSNIMDLENQPELQRFADRFRKKKWTKDSRLVLILIINSY